MSDPKVTALSHVPLLAHCSKKQLEFIASRADELDAPAGRQLTRHGESSGTFFLLLEGGADVEVDGKPHRRLGPGDFFGEISMLDGGPATATVVTSSPARLMVMSHAQFRDAIKASDELLTEVMHAMAERLRADASERGTAPA